MTGSVLSLALAFACNTPRSPTPPNEAVAPAAVPTTDAEELRAFAKLYGYVRFFHPADTSAAADWERVAIEGARRVLEGSNRDELVVALREVFEPLAPTVLVFPEDQPPSPAEPPRDGPVLAWQHVGFGFGDMRSVYDSGRTGRARMVWGESMGWAPVTGSIDATPLRGKRLRLRGWARVGGKQPGERAQLWLRVDRSESGSEFFDNMQDRPIVASEWTQATIETPVLGPTAYKVLFGGIAYGTGTVWFDDFSLETAAPAAKQWTAVTITNPGFEAGDQPDGWSTNAPDFTYTVVANAHAGGAALEVSSSTTETSAALFSERPKPGETFTRSLGAGLACRVVLGLPYTEATGPGGLVVQVQQPGPEDPAVRAASVVVAWNVLRHFYPYHDVTGEDWEAVLDDAIADVLDDEGPQDLALTLRRLVHRLHDGHGNVSGPGIGWATAPLRLAHVEGRYLVLAAPEGTGVARGDELLRVDGVAIDELMAERRGLHSGSPQWIDYKLLALGMVAEGRKGSVASVELRRGGEVRTFELTRAEGWPPEEPERPYISELDDGVFYVDLDRAPSAEIMKRMPELAAAPGVVFDLRGYPMEDPPWLPHLLSQPDTTKWMFVPKLIRPDYEGATTFSEHGWGLQPAKPRIAGKVAFITGPGAISYAESLMGYVEGYGLGAIVGAPTAGANGNVNPFTVPGDYQITFTGMKVTRMDGRQHHIVGVQPTHPVERTLAGILAGRDEELEAALAIVRGTR
jgi:Peptidase family S41